MPALRAQILRSRGIETVPRKRTQAWHEPVGPVDYGRGRRCAECGAYLCRYNGAETCWHHGLHDLDVDLLGEALEEMAA